MPKPSLSTTWLQQGSSLYIKVRHQITEAIRSGEWRPGDALPSEKVLCERFGVSMGTLRKAVDELTSSGVLVRQQGRGTFVSRHSQDRYLFSFFHLVRFDGQKEYPEVRYLSMRTVEANELTAQALSVKIGSPLISISNLLSLAGLVTSVDDILIPAALFPDLTAQRLKTRKTTLYQMYQDEFDISVVRTSERIRGCAATSAQAKLLNLTTGAPLLQIIRCAYTYQDQPIELRYSYVNTQHCEYRPEPFVQEYK